MKRKNKPYIGYIAIVMFFLIFGGVYYNNGVRLMAQSSSHGIKPCICDEAPVTNFEYLIGIEANDESELEEDFVFSGFNKINRIPTVNVTGHPKRTYVFITSLDQDCEFLGKGYSNPDRREGFGFGSKRPSQTAVARHLRENPFGLIPDIPCDVVQDWLNTVRHKVGQAELNKLKNIVSSSTVSPGIGAPGFTHQQVARLQNINNAYGSVINLDYFPIKINQLPIVNGQRLTPDQFLHHFRTNINNFVNTSKAEFTPYHWYGVNDAALWNSNNPLGAVIAIDIGGPDNGSVIVSHSSTDKWTFSTIYDPKYGEHPVSGHRDFGYVKNSDNSYTFYTRGVDRMTSWDGEWVREHLNNYPFSQSDALWTSFQDKLSAYVNQHGGSAAKLAQQIHRPDWTDVLAVLNGDKPLSTLSSDCDD